jgi:rhodanese-related sulfurtransferase
VTVEQARTLLHARGSKPDFIVLDVRTPGEFAGGHLPGAINMDVQSGDFETRLGALDRGKAYLVYCRSGNRSRRATQAMERMRFESVYHLSEGMLGWEKK